MESYGQFNFSLSLLKFLKPSPHEGKSVEINP